MECIKFYSLNFFLFSSRKILKNFAQNLAQNLEILDL